MWRLLLMRWLPLAIALALVGQGAQGTQVHIPSIVQGTGTVAADATIRLVDGAGVQVLGFRGTSLATEYSGVALGAAGATLELAPQGACRAGVTDCGRIATAAGTPTYYQVTIASKTGKVTGTYRVQVPDSATAVELSALVGAQAQSGGALAAERLLPSTTGASAGWGLVLGSDLLAQWSPAAGGAGCTTLACLLDGPGVLGTAGQVPTVASGGSAWAWATPTAAATWGAITGTLSAQSDLNTALAGKAAASHTQAWSTITSTPTTLAGYGITDGAGAPAWGAITGTLSAQSDLNTALAGKAAASHTQGWSTITSTPTTLAGYGITDGTAAPAWGAITGTLSAQGDLNTALAGKAAASHTQAWSTITSTPTTLAGYGIIDGAAAPAWGGITGTLSAQSDLNTALAGKAAASHTQAWSTITSTPTTLAGYGITDGAAAPAWGAITGTLSAQSDLNTALSAKAPTSHTQTASTISDSTTAGRALLTGADAAAQRTSLGLGSSATTAASAYATAAQGTDARTPTAHASTHGAAGSDPLTVAPSQISQSGATSGQVLAWSGSAWAATDEVDHGAVTLATPNRYLSLSGQQITPALVDLTAHVTGAVPIANGGTGSTTSTAALTALGAQSTLSAWPVGVYALRDAGGSISDAYAHTGALALVAGADPQGMLLTPNTGVLTIPSGQGGTYVVSGAFTPQTHGTGTVTGIGITPSAGSQSIIKGSVTGVSWPIIWVGALSAGATLSFIDVSGAGVTGQKFWTASTTILVQRIR